MIPQVRAWPRRSCWEMEISSCKEAGPAWTRSCAACCRWPCFGRGVGLDDPQRSLPTPTCCDSVILKFHWLHSTTGLKYFLKCSTIITCCLAFSSWLLSLCFENTVPAREELHPHEAYWIQYYCGEVLLCWVHPGWYGNFSGLPMYFLYSKAWKSKIFTSPHFLHMNVSLSIVALRAFYIS